MASIKAVEINGVRRIVVSPDVVPRCYHAAHGFPLLEKEGNVSALKQSVNSFTRSHALGYDLFAAARLNQFVDAAKGDLLPHALISRSSIMIRAFCAGFVVLL